MCTRLCRCGLAEIKKVKNVSAICRASGGETKVEYVMDLDAVILLQVLLLFLPFYNSKFCFGFWWRVVRSISLYKFELIICG